MKADAAAALTRLADAIAARDWPTLRAVLADDFVVTLLPKGEELDAYGFVRFNRDYPGDWQYLRDEVVCAGDRAALRTRTRIGDETWYAASFGSVDAAGRLKVLVEVWSEAVSAEASGAPRPA